MNQLLKNRTLNIIVLVLLVVNIATIGFLWLREPSEFGQPLPGKRGEVVEFLVRELNMSDAQKQALIQLRTQHRATAQPLRRNIEQLKDDFFVLVKNDQATEATINAAIDKVAVASNAMDILTLYHFKAIRKVCNEQQKIKFDEIVQQALRMMRPGPPPPRNK